MPDEMEINVIVLVVQKSDCDERLLFTVDTLKVDCQNQMVEHIIYNDECLNQQKLQG